ncbi:MAG: peptidase T [Ruthenibacterium sp.]
MRASERFISYAKLYTTSDEKSETTPSTARQKVLADLLCTELTELGIAAQVDDQGYVYASMPATHGCENAPALGFIAHMDTAPAFSGEHVMPILHKNYDGGDVALPREGRVIRVADFPALRAWKGRTLITADGSTLLGADDKAGLAEIMTACDALLQSGAPHGKICIAFTPDEEIGAGADHFDVEKFGAKYAYTVDGDEEGEISYENFNAASAVFDITGVSVHPGSAKNVMENAYLLAFEINAALPANETPAHTQDYEGFYHLEAIEGDAARARMSYIVRDHDAQKFAARKALLERTAAFVQAKHPAAQIALTLTDTYYNMAQQIAPCMHLIENAKAATEKAGAQPHIIPIRGGTDGSRLSYLGLPCPNIGTGGTNFHGPYECITVEGMDTVVEILLNLAALYAKQGQ